SGSGGTITLTGGELGAKASHTGTVHTTSDGEAAGGSVGVGVSLALNIGTHDTESLVARNFSGAGAVNVTAGSTLSSIAESKASAKGNSSSNSDADTETSNQTSFAQNQSGGTKSPTQSGSSSLGTANSNSSGQSGQSTGSGGTSVAATVAVNFLDGDAKARVADGVTVSGSGAVKVETTHQTTAHALATATATNTDADTGVAAAVGLNIVLIDASAEVGDDASVTGSSVAVNAVMPDGTINSYKVRALSGAASKQTAVGGSIGVNYLDTSARAEVGHDATLTGTTGDVAVGAV